MTVSLTSASGSPTSCADLPALLPGIEWITEPLKVGRLSTDFAWFSPVLKRQLAGKRGEIVAKPRNETEIRDLISVCARAGIPLTLRGAGTGNYGQSTPLHGGVIMDMSAFQTPLWVRDGIGRAQAGIRLSDFDTYARQYGSELRWLPSTFRTATLGGLYGGGFGGAGSITYGPVAAVGNVLGARVMTMEAEPRILELRGAEALLLHHTYGTTGIVLELEVALAPAYEWLECIATFDSFEAGLRFSSEIAQAPALIKKEIGFMAAPIPQYLDALQLPAGCHATLMLLHPSSEPGMLEIMARHGGTLSYRKTADDIRNGAHTLIEFTWNHTTLNAFKHDKSITYLQSGYDPACYVEQAMALETLLQGEVLTHLEFLRTKEGPVNCSGLQIVRYTDDARLQEIMQIFRDHGVHMNNPHVYIVEDGKQGRVNPDVVDLKARLDPQGLLNPGKLRGWDERQQTCA
ncbi:FAD-binding oxidoreductase [Kerstersia similis]|uniref:FAD-binding oxidoreductase n=1 Tax=Kerstersia similis TaxID=206505 RepID=UPI0039F0FA10